jgi:hypothetical protein
LRAAPWQHDGMTKTPSTKAAPVNPWTTRFHKGRPPKRVRLDKDFAGIKAGTLMFVGTPPIIDAYLRKVPPGETRTIERMRRELARAHQCDATCPVSTAIFLRIAAEAAIEHLQRSQPVLARDCACEFPAFSTASRRPRLRQVARAHPCAPDDGRGVSPSSC